MKSTKPNREKAEGEIVIPILNDEYKVIVCFGDPRSIEKVLKVYHHNPAHTMLDDHNDRGRCFYTKGCYPVIAMPSFPETPEQIGTLAHEAVHAITYMFEGIGEGHTDEILAHSVGAVVRNVLKENI